MNVMKTLAAATALAVVSTHALAQVAVPPPPYSDQIATGANGGAIFTLFSVNPDTPYSYAYSLGLNVNDLLPANGMTTPGVNLVWALPTLTVPGTVASSDLRWTVTAPGQGNSRNAGSAHLLTTAALGASAAALAAQTTGGAIVTTASSGGAFVNILNGNAGTPDITTGGTDPLNALNSWNDHLQGLPFNVAGGISDALSFFLFTNAAATAAPNATRYQSAAGALGQWALNLAGGTVTYSISAVPLPAGVWLLLSGLAGLGVVGRRRNKPESFAAIAA